MEKGSLSEKQNEILEFIKSVTLAKGYPPAVREICAAVNLKSPASVHAHLNAIEEKGYIRRDPTKPRAIEIIDDDFAITRRECAQVPILGRVAAGSPILAEENVKDYFPIPVDMLPNAEIYMLEVHGDSMINAGIFDGDKVIVKKTHTARNGDMVVAMIEDGATVKYFNREEGHIRLQPANPDYDPIIVPDCEILGEVIGVFRLY